MVDAADEEIDRLYELPLAEFVGARNELGKKLAKAGDKEGAAEVKKLGKPSIASWVINQLVRRHGEDVDAFLKASDRVFRAQLRAMSGAGGGLDPDFRDAVEEQKSALAALLDLAAPILESAGHDAGRNFLDRIARTMRSVVLDETARKKLEAGQLGEDLEEAGFDLLAASLAGAPGAGKAAGAGKAKALPAKEKEPSASVKAAREAAAKELKEAREAEAEESEDERTMKAVRESAEAEARADAKAEAKAEAKAQKDAEREAAHAEKEELKEQLAAAKQEEKTAREEMRAIEKDVNAARAELEEARGEQRALTKALNEAKKAYELGVQRAQEAEGLMRDIEATAEDARSRLLESTKAVEVLEGALGRKTAKRKS